MRCAKYGWGIAENDNSRLYTYKRQCRATRGSGKVYRTKKQADAARKQAGSFTAKFTSVFMTLACSSVGIIGAYCALVL